MLCMPDLTEHCHTQPYSWVGLYEFLYALNFICTRHMSIRLYAHRDDFVLENEEQHSQALALLEQARSLLHTVALQNTSVVDKMKLVQISKLMVGRPSDSVSLIIQLF